VFRITERTDAEAETLQHSRDVFSKALKLGKELYHVTGAFFGDYDISYVKNNDLVPEKYRKIKKGTDIYPSYLTYDSGNVDSLELSLLKEHRIIEFEEFNEYSIVLGQLALSHTDAEVYYHDERIYGFIEPSERLHVSETFDRTAEDDPEHHILHVADEFVSGTLEGSFHTISTMPLFHSVFFWQDLAGHIKGKVRYVEVAIADNVGIGGVLSYYTMAKKLFTTKGWDTFLRKNGSRYPDEMIHHYFNISECPDDADASNTVFIDNFTSISMTYLCSKCSSDIDTSILSDVFRSELEEYAETVLGGHKVLGILIRGTDYIASGMTGARQMATVEDMLPTIQEWIREDGYDRIFLATEDQDVLEKMKKEFGSMVIAVSQVRHRVSDFVNVKLLSDLEKTEDDYTSVLEDNTSNYFYALYLLSRCQSLMVSGQCHGWTVANSFNGGHYLRSYKFQVGLEKH